MRESLNLKKKRSVNLTKSKIETVEISRQEHNAMMDSIRREVIVVDDEIAYQAVSFIIKMIFLAVIEVIYNKIIGFNDGPNEEFIVYLFIVILVREIIQTIMVSSKVKKGEDIMFDVMRGKYYRYDEWVVYFRNWRILNFLLTSIIPTIFISKWGFAVVTCYIVVYVIAPMIWDWYEKYGL